MKIPIAEMPLGADGESYPCLHNIFVHPATGLAYFSCPLPKGVVGQLRVDLPHNSVTQIHLPHVVNMAPTFLYDAQREWRYLNPGVAVVDVNDQIVTRIDGIDIPGRGAVGIEDMSLLPKGRLVALLAEEWSDKRAAICTYDPAARKLGRLWTEDRKGYLIPNAPMPSRDGTRLFGIEGLQAELFSPKSPTDEGILWDTATLQSHAAGSFLKPGAMTVNSAIWPGSISSSASPQPPTAAACGISAKAAKFIVSTTTPAISSKK